MASSPRTYDVALWSPSTNCWGARQAATQLADIGWRVRLMQGGQPREAADARVCLALLEGRRITPALVKRLAGEVLRSEDLVDVRSPLGGHHVRWANMASYDAIAEQFAEQWFKHPPQRELEQFMQRLQRGSRVLDAGCGPGHHAALLAGAGHEVIGIDLSAGMLRQARLRAPTVHTARMNLESLQFGEAAFDAIWCAAAILHVPREHLPRVLAGFRRVLRPGGLLGLNFQVGRASELVERGRDRRFFEYYPDARWVMRQLRAAGFTVESTLYGETGRNTHGLEMTLKWSTVYATAWTASLASRIERHSSSSPGVHARK